MSGVTSLEYVYRYPFSSLVSGSDNGLKIQLATSQTGNRYPYFFNGRVLQPRALALALSTLSRIVGARYYVPPAMLKRIIAERDPVVTSGGGMLRFEGFSACCSAYARVDLTADGYEGTVISHGTTNVDFNAPMRAVLARIRDNDRLEIAVGADELMLRTGFEGAIERKAQLPLRWLKGFVEAQAYQSAMELRFRVDRAESIRFLRSLPRSAENRSLFWVVASGKGLRLSQTNVGCGVPIRGLERLRLLQDLAPVVESLCIYAHPTGEASEWQLQCGPLSFNLAITAEASRGFSGEGQVLTDLAGESGSNTARVRAALKWQSVIDLDEIAAQAQVTGQEARRLLGILGSRGLVGYDRHIGAYFHRELPFDISRVEEMHPRLKNARKIIESGGVRVLRQSDNLMEAEVAGSDVQHRVRITEDDARCTCQWHAKYQSSRGPCKHIIALQMFDAE